MLGFEASYACTRRREQASRVDPPFLGTGGRLRTRAHLSRNTRTGVPRQVMHSSSYFPLTSVFFVAGARPPQAPSFPEVGSNLCRRKTTHSSSYFPAHWWFLGPEQDSARHPHSPKPEATYAGARLRRGCPSLGSARDSVRDGCRLADPVRRNRLYFPMQELTAAGMAAA